MKIKLCSSVWMSKKIKIIEVIEPSSVRMTVGSETIMLNINKFKKLCLKSNTDNADKIHDYYIKLEMVYNELIKNKNKCR
jgi:hypothetical protein